MQRDCCFNVYCGICVNVYSFNYRSSYIKVSSRVRRKRVCEGKSRIKQREEEWRSLVGTGSVCA